MRKPLTFIFYGVYTLLILEVTSRLILGIPPVFDRILGFDDASGRLGWIRRHQETHMDVIHGFDLYHPTRGWAIRPNVTGMPVFECCTLNTNSRGIRGQVEYDYQKPAGKTRILVLGDSFTFGEEVNDTETYAYYLQQLLPESEVINFGVHGYGHDQMLLYLREEGVKYRPDIVLLGFIDDDMYRNMVGFRDYAKPSFKLVNGRLTLLNSPVSSPEDMLKQEFFRLKIVDVLTMLHQKILWKSGVNAKKMEELTAAILAEIAATSTEIGATPVFVYLPDEVDDRALPGQNYLLDYCRERQFFCTSVLPNFQEYVRQSSDNNFRLAGGHWKPVGHRLAAQGIAGYLEQSLLAPRQVTGVQE